MTSNLSARFLLYFSGEMMAGIFTDALFENHRQSFIDVHPVYPELVCFPVDFDTF